MRIIQLSDIHLSDENHHELVHYHLPALIKDLRLQNQEQAIDMIIINGDLVDKGGKSLLSKFSGFTNPFEIFAQEFIMPLINELGVNRNNLVFVPGNHDVDESEILWMDECFLSKEITHANISKHLNDNVDNFSSRNRLHNFKTFEENFTSTNPNYIYSPNQSTFIFEDEAKTYKIGFVLANDSWRCRSGQLADDTGKIFFGHQQLDHGLKVLEAANTDLNIFVSHHPLNTYAEQTAVERILITKNFEMFLAGHVHRTKYDLLDNTVNRCIGFRARALLNRPDEPVATYQPGYSIIDIDHISYTVRIMTREYIYDQVRFDADVRSFPGGATQQIPLYREGRIMKTFGLKINDFLS